MAIGTEPGLRARAVETGVAYLDWPAVFGGAVLAAALSIILLTFGSGLGLSIVSPEPGEGVSLRWLTIAGGVWFVWVAITSFAAGGYLAGRLRRRAEDATGDETETRDGAHGVVVWAVATLFSAGLAAGGVGGLMNAASNAAGSAAAPVAQVIEEQGDYFTDLVLRGQDGSVASPEAREQASTILARYLRQGEISDGDRQYLVQLAANETGVAPEEIEAGVTAAMDEVEAARQTAIDVAEQARIASVVGIFVLAATMLIGAVAAYFAATTGGHHRDRGLAFGRIDTFVRR